MAEARRRHQTSAAGGGGSPPGDGQEDVKQKAQEAKRKAEQKAEEAKAQAEEVASDAKRKAEQEVDRRTSQGADRLDTVVRALHSAADQLDDDGQEWLADYTRKAASQVDRVTGYLRDEDAPAMLSDLERMARSNPGTFLGTTFAAGLAAGRFLRSSQPAESDGAGSGSGRVGHNRSPAGYGSGRGGGPPASSGRTTTASTDRTSAAAPISEPEARSGGPARASRSAGGVPTGGETRQDKGRS